MPSAAPASGPRTTPIGAWRTADAGKDELVPVGKAHSGFTDQELLRLDRWVRENTVERFGPVRSVRPALVLEIAFDAIQPSARHKSGSPCAFHASTGFAGTSRPSRQSGWKPYWR